MTAAVLLAAALAAPRPAASAPPRPPPDERRAAEQVTPALVSAHVQFLASDLLEGRGPGTRGDALAQAYLEATLRGLGLAPAAPEGGYLQRVPLVGVTTSVAAAPRFEGKAGALALAPGEYMATAGVPEPAVALDRAEVVFVGYGIVAPEYGWDDYAKADVKGKVVLVMNDDPSDDPARFGGKARLYYGRWTYKYEEAARHGAAGAIIIHTTPSASYPWQVVQTSWSGEEFELGEGVAAPRLRVKMWTTEDASRRLVALGGHDLDALRAAANRRGFAAVPLGLTLSVGLTARVSRTETANVLAKLPGSDPARAGEVVLLTAHHDHLGKKANAAPGEDAIYNGAVDNATGCAAVLAIARALEALPRAPARTVVFAFVGAEEQGTLGSEWLALHPPVPIARVVADLNLDGLNVFGRTRDLTLIGLGKSSLDEDARAVAGWQGRTVAGDPFPEKGVYYRSDHFSFAKVGVPSVSLGGGVEFVGRPPGWGKENAEAWTARHYHQPSDAWNPAWDLSGLVQDARLAFHLAVRVANAPGPPRWRPGDEFEAVRASSLAAPAAP
ncbi:MAG: M20/M25/M40 family metallo-hydrolase [Anaeromyxobacteraceae bacterium]